MGLMERWRWVTSVLSKDKMLDLKMNRDITFVAWRRMTHCSRSRAAWGYVGYRVSRKGNYHFIGYQALIKIVQFRSSWIKKLQPVPKNYLRCWLDVYYTPDSGIIRIQIFGCFGKLKRMFVIGITCFSLPHDHRPNMRIVDANPL